MMQAGKPKSPFKAYDVRGRVPDELNEDVAYRIGCAYRELFEVRHVVVGYDARLSSPALAEALAQGLLDSGCDVTDIGLCGTEQVYFATAHMNLDGGIMVTASHNPADYNGMKFVLSQARPVSGDTGLRELEARVLAGGQSFGGGAGSIISEGAKGRRRRENSLPPYVAHLLSYVDPTVLRPLKVVVNAGNGCAGPVIDALAPHLPFAWTRVNHEPDGSFPHGIPNPLLPENREATARAVQGAGADVGIAWDGDFDRCFFFDEQGQFIEGYYLVGLLGQSFARRYPGAKIIHDPRLIWNTIELVAEDGGVPVQSKTGHAFMKERMRREDAVYGGEMSAHHYFRDFAYCDSGMIPWLLVLEAMCRENRPLSALVGERMRRFPCSGEINRSVPSLERVLERVERFYAGAGKSDMTDGLSMDFGRWRFNLRASNTEPLLRLNVETRGDEELLQQKTAELLALIDREEG
ncbi:phosphoglucomutase/phosphomannomutase [Heliomicrobium modesticaldum Ice1]|uniref:Phosphoglucomutase/phosphomannomutase n=1 Tax=Heliobacterium modesticaldum (strain ATCC 51547 / Ice1) TaxID=498761 RepID=B0TH10_HELMI|nr:phosphomannomutase/phosphoglucomutase [Heliomicrobium modesticaldum]ABZ83335.1 phosphoglucomutase/phosphomannomutase [Heliomicrobium modesticaldum Ice1]